MKKSIFSVFLIVYSFVPFNVAALDFLEQLYFPDSISIRCITTNEQGHVFVGVGDSQETGGVYRSTDDALNWELVLIMKHIVFYQ